MKITMKMLDGREKAMPEAHARLLAKLGKATYLTRDMVAAPARQEATPANAEVDTNGAKWDAAIHTSTKLKNADGSWRKKPGRG
jgi:hypothetical protein